MKDIDPILISEGDDLTEVLVIEIGLERMKIRCVNAYGPQESSAVEKQDQRYIAITNSIKKIIQKLVYSWF